MSRSFPCGGRLCEKYRKSRSLFRNVRTGSDESCDGNRHGNMDSVPIVAITCNVNVPLLGKDSFQEIDIAGITTPITKHNFIVKDVTKLADTIRRAFRIAQKGRPGPVLVDIPKDITAAKTEYDSARQSRSRV